MRRVRHFGLSVLPLLLIAAAFPPSPADAQTTVVVNPTTVVFAPSADHNARLSDGRLKIDYYRFDVYAVGASQPFQSTDLGYPNPASDGLIYHNFSSAIAAWPLPGGNYEARVAAVGPSGAGVSSVSNPFTFGSSCSYALSGTSASASAAGGGTQVTVTTTSSCSWTASESSSWLSLSTTGGRGTGTVVITVAANTSTSTRTAAVSVAGKAFTITQAGATGTTPNPTLPAPWQGADIGSVGVAGSSSYSSGVYTVTGSGSDIWGSADSFRYAYQPLPGDGQIVARVTSLQNTHPQAKAGVMLRASLAANAAHVVLDLKPTGGVEFMSRSATGGTTSYLGSTTQPAPAWLRLVRTGTTVRAAVSADGSTWRSVGSVTVSLGSSACVGLAVTSHNAGTRNTATFDNVSVGSQSATTAALPSPWVNQDIGSVGLSGSASYSSGRFTVTGAGADIYGTADSFHFVHQPLSGDGQIVARMTGQQNTHGYAKAGVMLRSGLSAGAAHVILDVLPSGSVEFMKRSSSGGSTSYLTGTTQAPPAWLRLARSGSTVTASVSADGSTWRTVGTTTVSMGAAYVGLAVTSHVTSVRNTATFDYVSVR